MGSVFDRKFDSIVRISDVPLPRNVFAKYRSGPQYFMEIRDYIPRDVDIALLLKTWIEEREMLGLSAENLLRLQSLTQAQAVLACLWLARCYIYSLLLIDC